MSPAKTIVAIFSALLAASSAVSAQYTATYLPGNTPNHSEDGQYGTNQCGTGSNQESLCQNAFINSIEDFCVWAPPYSDGKNATIGETERYEVAWCLKDGYGTRLIPDGTIIGAHWVETPDYVQITGNGDFTKIGIPKGDSGGELDPHGADGNGNPIGGLVFGNSFGKMQQYHEWTSFMSDTEFCFRACKPGPNATKLCQHVYDVMGCQWNMPGDYSNGVFDSCMGDSAQPMGVYGTSTFHQGDPVTPEAHPKPATSQCTTTASLTQINPSATHSSSSATITPVASHSQAAASATATTSAHNAALGRSVSWEGVAFGSVVGLVGVLAAL
ncbi:hypothetical protein FRC04_003464 [Tulasnella sp. 424]|nr:hypothetical protein FRC04_003464 [Tulasnella sp. 424]KAG8965728.1 hypothetical protein FRC05_003045 [Tulasnella sp. 425]